MTVSSIKAWQFSVPTRIDFGAGQSRQLPEIVRSFGRRVFLVGYRAGTPLDGLYHDLASRLLDNGLEVGNWLGVAEEPDILTARNAYHAAKEFCPEVVLGIGGGSVLDLAKITAYQLRQGRPLDGRELESTGRPKAPVSESDRGRFSGSLTSLPALILVPTTPGTGSEVTAVAVLRHTLATNSGEEAIATKLAIDHPLCRANVAVVDPQLCQSCPPRILMMSVADILAHAIEGLLSRSRNPLGLVFAKEAIRLVARHLPGVYEGPIPPEVWEEFSLAGILGGLTVEARGAVVGHALAHALGAIFGLPHGLAVSLSLVPAIEFNRSEAAEIWNSLVAEISLSGKGITAETPDIASHVDHWIAPVRKLALEYLPPALDPVVVDNLVASADGGSRLSLRLNPRRVSSQDLRALFTRILSQKPAS